jgi:transcriptional regulator with XRE-family HTH domain
MTNKQEFDADGFYQALERSVRTRKASWKDVSQQTGISQTTLTRMAQGRRPDAASMAALSAWAGINPANYVSSKVPRFAGSQTLDQVALLFRQDAQLSDDARSKLESIVESAYNALKAAPRENA